MDALVLHIKRSNFQVAEWKDALICDKIPLDPNGNGWERNENKLQIKWATKKNSTRWSLEFVICNCKKSRSERNKCPYFTLDMKCTDLCNCKSWSNVYTDEDVEATAEDNDYENFDDDWDDMTDNEEDLLDNDNIWLGSGFLVKRNFCLYEKTVLFCYKETHALFNKI